MGKKSGFSLAEVIITLVIVGVVAATTIPVMVTNIQDQQFKTAWKKAFADLNQATQLIMNENGGKMSGICPDGDHNCFLNKYTKRLSYIKKCYSGEALGNCWVAGFKKLNGIPSYESTFYSRAILTNGTFLKFEHIRDDCTYTEVDWIALPICGDIVVDVNGYSGPNIVGRDIFAVWIQKDGIKPWGTQGDSDHIPKLDCTRTGAGHGCSAMYLYQ